MKKTKVDKSRDSSLASIVASFDDDAEKNETCREEENEVDQEQNEISGSHFLYLCF